MLFQKRYSLIVVKIMVVLFKTRHFIVSASKKRIIQKNREIIDIMKHDAIFQRYLQHNLQQLQVFFRHIQ